MAKVLIVEDDFILMQILANKFNSSNFETKTVEDGRAVLEALESYSPDVMLLDIIIPNKNGVDVLKEIRKNEKYTNLPVLVLSNLDDDKIKSDCMSLNVAGYYVKSDTSLDVIVAKAKEIVGS